MNIKKIISLTSALIMAASVTVGAKTLEFKMGDYNMYESDGKISAFPLENAPYTKNDRTMVPVRIISERFGAEVGWNEEKQEVSIAKDGRNILLTLGSNTAYVNGEAVTLDVAPEEFNGRTMIPLRFVSETLEMDVKYVNSTQQVIISDNESLLTIAGIDITIDNYRSVMLGGGYKPGESDTAEYVKEASEAFKLIYGASSKILSEGEYTLGTDSESVNSTVSALKDNLTQNNALTSTLAEYMDYQTVVVNKAIYEALKDTTLDTPDMAIVSAAEELFNKHIAEGSDGVEIIIHKTDEEIVKLFE